MRDDTSERLRASIDRLNENLETPARAAPVPLPSPKPLTQEQQDALRHALLASPGSPYRRAQAAKKAHLEGS